MSYKLHMLKLFHIRVVVRLQSHVMHLHLANI